MSRIPSKSENPNGLHQRYIVDKIEGTVDTNAVYFVLRLDRGGSDAIHIAACRNAARTYSASVRQMSNPGSPLILVARELEQLIDKLDGIICRR